MLRAAAFTCHRVSLDRMLMKMRLLYFFFLFLIIPALTKGQACTTLGQTPSTAFPVCGSTVFTQNSVPICKTTDIIVPGCSGSSTVYENKNPFWYKLTCYQGGTLSFLVKPFNASDDYDWQLWDITGHSPNEVFTNASLVVAGNWAGTYGSTGASASGVSGIQCASIPSDNAPSFAKSPTLIAGHEYILLISHFTDSQSGYTLSFGGGTAVITDPLEPKLASASAACDGQEIRLKLNKKMLCTSLTGTGSEFTLSPNVSAVVSATAPACGGSFDMDSIIITLNNPLPPGIYTLYTQLGSDNNTILDVCSRQIPVRDSVKFEVYPLIPTPMDSITKPGCAPQTLDLVFRKGIRCNSIAANGSDFRVTGPSPVTITGAAGNCMNGLTTHITVTLSAPLVKGGTYTILLQPGSDGNTIFDECGQQTPAGQPLNFPISDTVNASFTQSILYNCDKNVVTYQHPGGNGITNWDWIFPGNVHAYTQTAVKSYPVIDSTITTLIVHNDACADTATQTIFFENYLHASFESTNLACPGDTVSIKNTSTGRNINGYAWDLGNGNTSILDNPPAQIYPSTNVIYKQKILLTISNSYGCSDTAYRYTTIVNNCYIAVPTAFTPNNDGLNDYLYPLNAYKARDLTFSVYNRIGQRIFFTRDWTNKWDGRYRGQQADPGTYVWMLQYTHADTGKKVFQKGTTILIR